MNTSLTHQLTKEFLFEELMNSYDFIDSILETDSSSITEEKLLKLASRFGYKKNKEVISKMILYFAHERVWYKWIKFGLSNKESKNI